MSCTLWIDTSTERAVELGPTIRAYRAFDEMREECGLDAWSDEYGALAGVVNQCESQEDADTSWLQDVRDQAAAFLLEYGDVLSQDALDVLEALKVA